MLYLSRTAARLTPWTSTYSLSRFLSSQPTVSVVMSAPRGNGPKRPYYRRRPGPRTFQTTANPTAAATPSLSTSPPPTNDGETRSKHFSIKKFADAPISLASKNSISHEFMSDVQAATLEPGIAGHDLLVQAKTGTGKTLAFLLPLVERLKANPPVNKNKISVLILSPTRELALQIEQEAKTLLRNHEFKVQHAIGGTNIRTEHSKMTTQGCDILVATPGRLLDLVTTYRLESMFTDLRAFVLDECDRLLDTGFKPQLEQIVNMINRSSPSPRQSLLFSATVSDEVKKIAATTLRPGYKFITTLSEDDLNVHEHVPQTHLKLPFSAHLPALLSILREDIVLHPGRSKPIVFFPTAKHAAAAAATLRNIKGLPDVLEIHSRLSQNARMKAANTFRDARSAILLSSDVAARGMDFPLVSVVIQAGLPSDTDQYIHRLGRTARAGSTLQSRGVVILSPDESSFFLGQSAIKALNIQQHNLFEDTDAAADITRSLSQTETDLKSQAYRAWLGYYNGYKKKLGWSSQELVDKAAEYARESLGWKEEKLPGVYKRALNQMGLSGVNGLNIEAPPQRPPNRRPKT